MVRRRPTRSRVDALNNAGRRKRPGSVLMRVPTQVIDPAEVKLGAASYRAMPLAPLGWQHLSNVRSVLPGYARDQSSRRLAHVVSTLAGKGTLSFRPIRSMNWSMRSLASCLSSPAAA